MILISVDLPAPFSPTSACTSPGMQFEGDALEGADAGERFGDGGRGEEHVGVKAAAGADHNPGLEAESSPS